MKQNLTLFDLDHTLIPIDSDHEWGQFLVRVGAVDAASFTQRNDDFFKQYQEGTLDTVQYLEFALGTLAQFSPAQLHALRAEFMQEVIQPALRPAAIKLLKHHQDQGDLVAIITATNRFVTEPIAKAFNIQHLIAAIPETLTDGTITGKLIGIPSSGAGKITHLHDWLTSINKSLDDFPESRFYSDSQNDIPLLSLVTHPIATNPNAKLLAHAKARGWPILQLFHD